jgi:hypothetical protein
MGGELRTGLSTRYDAELYVLASEINSDIKD